MNGQSRTTESIRWRGGQVTRIEALTDAVFGFTITLLAVSLEVPATFEELMGLMRGFVAFAFSFTLLILVWTYHYRLFSRYDLEDGWTIVLNSVLLFVVLFYVYPLKFVASFLLGGVDNAFTSLDQVPLMMAIYSSGFVAVFLVFTALYRHAYALRDRLGLSAEEAHDARAHVANCLVMAGVGVVSVLCALLIPGPIAAPVAGFIYFLIGPLQWLVSSRMRRLGPASIRPDGIAPVEPAEPMPPIHTS
jgi:uncharacterized membrane protein